MKIEKITNESIDLDSFDRRQEVKRVYVNENGKCVLKDQVWTMDWSLEHKRKVAAELLADKNISYVAYDGGRIVGFVSVVKNLHGHRMVLDMIQVDRKFRGQGIENSFGIWLSPKRKKPVQRNCTYLPAAPRKR